jgi:hypothetical protein
MDLIAEDLLSDSMGWRRRIGAEAGQETLCPIKSGEFKNLRVQAKIITEKLEFYLN